MENENLARTVGKALDILDCLGREKTCLSASEVARHCGLSRPTAYRLLNTLLNRGYVTPDRSQEEKYRLGYKILELSKSLLDSVELRQQALPFLQDLSRTVNETVHLAVLDRNEVVYIEKVESNQAVRMHSTIGSRNPVHCTALGKAILAYLPPEPQAALLEKASLSRRTLRTITDRAELQAHLEQVRAQGFAVDDMENEDGIRCVGAPIFDHQGRVIAALSVSGPAYRLDLERAYQLAAQVKAAGRAVSRELGYVE